ncbi:major tail protein [Oceanobacillus profundus]|uniref:major tail protein n=1 Tax=Oceanobacillus TaxID=182709 RepID=UPI00203F29A4|nr:major tail protein [Oceanobacillus profundus]MCM3396784.1 phage tail protein [Oceanobacillus profundus]MDO6448086.1 phage tail protein [Oceanobacillus profundus]
MAEKKKARLIHGLSNFHMAVLNKDDSTGVEYGTIEHIEGAVSVSGTPNEESTPKYADNGIFAQLDNFESFDVEMAAVDIPEEMQADMFGEKVVNGVTFSNKDDIKKEIALGFEAKLRGGGKRFYWLLKGTPAIMGIEHATDEGTITAQDANLSISFRPLMYNGEWRARLSSEIVSTEDWFADVVYDEETAEVLPTATP